MAEVNTSALAQLPIPRAAELTRVVDGAHAMIHGVIVSNDAEHQLMIDEVRNAKATLDKLTEERLKITRPIDQAKAAVMDLFRGPTQRLEALIEEGKRACLEFRRRVEEQAAARQRELEAQARAEREAAEAEARRLAAASNAAATESEQVTLRQQAAAAAMEAATIVAPVVASRPAAVAGAHTRKVWDAEVTDADAAVAALMANPMTRACVVIDTAALRKVATIIRGAVKIDGVRFYEKEGMALR